MNDKKNSPHQGGGGNVKTATCPHPRRQLILEEAWLSEIVYQSTTCTARENFREANNGYAENVCRSDCFPQR